MQIILLQKFYLTTEGSDPKNSVGWPQKMWEVQLGGMLEVDSKKLWEVGVWPHKQVGDGRLDPQTGGRWETEPRNKWEIGGWSPKQVGDGRLRALSRPLTGLS